MNQWRSPTAEKIYSDAPLVVARSCGTSHKAKKTVSAAELQWAEIVFVMEQKHRQRLQSEYSGEMRFKTVYVLDIPDNYKFMDPELVVEIQKAVDPILNRKEGD